MEQRSEFPGRLSWKAQGSAPSLLGTARGLQARSLPGGGPRAFLFLEEVRSGKERPLSGALVQRGDKGHRLGHVKE